MRTEPVTQRGVRTVNLIDGHVIMNGAELSPEGWYTPRTLDPITMDEATQREAGRLLIRMGRAWLKLTPEDVERGARAVATDPGYGAEIVQAATIHARELRSFAILEAVRAAGDTVRNGWSRTVAASAADTGATEPQSDQGQSTTEVSR